MTPSAFERRAADINDHALKDDLEAKGWHIVPRLLSPEACASLRGSYGDEALFRSIVTMQRHGFGRGEYRYYRYPLPTVVGALRTAFYPLLAARANDWARSLGRDMLFPEKHDVFTAMCRDSGQSRPTPLILRYGAGDYNCLHQDLYGDLHFPLQMAILLSEPGSDFTGGEFVITEQRPRMQSRPHVVPLKRGDAVIFAVNEAPRVGARGTYRVKLRHGVSEILSGDRFALGIIFHDAA